MIIKITSTFIYTVLMISICFAQENSAQKKSLTADSLKKERERLANSITKIKGSVPVFINGNNPSEDELGDNVLASSIIAPYSPSLLTAFWFNGGEYNIPNHQGYKRTRSSGTITNHSIESTFQILYRPPFEVKPAGFVDLTRKVPQSRIEFSGLDTSKLVFFVNGKLINENTFTTQYTTHLDLSDSQLRKIMIKEVENCFGLKTGWEKRKKACIVISRNGYPLKEYTEGKPIVKWGNDIIEINKIDMRYFVMVMEASSRLLFTDYPIVDETGFNGLLGHIVFNDGRKQDYQFLSKELPKYGLTLSIQEREVDVLVIRKDPESDSSRL